MPPNHESSKDITLPYRVHSKARLSIKNVPATRHTPPVPTEFSTRSACIYHAKKGTKNSGGKSIARKVSRASTSDKRVYTSDLSAGGARTEPLVARDPRVGPRITLSSGADAADPVYIRAGDESLCARPVTHYTVLSPRSRAARSQEKARTRKPRIPLSWPRARVCAFLSSFFCPGAFLP